jgi:hypothetical protein
MYYTKIIYNVLNFVWLYYINLIMHLFNLINQIIYLLYLNQIY